MNMVDLRKLQDSVRSGLKWVKKQPDVKQAEVYASANNMKTMRLCYCSNVPSNGLEEPKSIENFGLSARILFDNGMSGFGKSDNELSLDAVKAAFTKARKNRTHDTDFHSLPSPSEKPKLKDYHDRRITRLDDGKAIELAYKALYGAVDNLNHKKFEPNLNLTGEVNFLSERVAIVNSNGIDEYDESTIATCDMTTIFEMKKDVSGMWFASATDLKSFDTYHAGKVSVDKAYSAINARKIQSGNYDVVMGRQAFGDLLYSRLAVSLSSIDHKASPYIGRLDEKIAPDFLNISDDALYPGAIGTKRITDEGLATTKTDIIKRGKLVNFLSNDYYAKKYPQDPRFNARNGFRFAGGRSYAMDPSIAATNLVVGKGDYNDEELIEEVKNGIFIGRIWYSYPVNGLTSADFTSTVRGDSYLIENGEIVSGIVPNTIRISENFNKCLANIAAIGKEQKPTLGWGEESVVITPEVAIKGMHLQRIAKGLY